MQWGVLPGVKRHANTHAPRIVRMIAAQHAIELVQIIANTCAIIIALMNVAL